MTDAAELAVTDGAKPPRDLPAGEFLTSMRDGRLYINQADPRILISAALLDMIKASPSPMAVLDDATLTLTITAANCQVTYRIVSYQPSVNGYIAERES